MGCSHILRHLNTCSLVDTVKGCLGDVALLEDCFEVSKATYYFQCVLSASCLWFEM